MLAYKGMCNISVDCEAGIYAFPPESATGKTLLYNMLAAMSPYDVLLGTRRREFVVDLQPDSLQAVKLALFDRVDTYATDSRFMMLANSLPHDAIILLDYKGQGLILDRKIDTAEFDFVSPERIEVFA